MIDYRELFVKYMAKQMEENLTKQGISFTLEELEQLRLIKKEACQMLDANLYDWST